MQSYSKKYFHFHFHLGEMAKVTRNLAFLKRLCLFFPEIDKCFGRDSNAMFTASEITFHGPTPTNICLNLCMKVF